MTPQETINRNDVLACLNMLRSIRRHWHTLRAQFLALDPPYIGRQDRRRPLTKLQLQALYDLQGGFCAYCVCTLQPLGSWSNPALRTHPNCPHIEHRIPVTRGGTNDLSNLCVACYQCNTAKGIRTPEEFAMMPGDPITRLPLPPRTMLWMLEVEDRYDRAHPNGPSFAAIISYYRFGRVIPQAGDGRGLSDLYSPDADALRQQDDHLAAVMYR